MPEFPEFEAGWLEQDPTLDAELPFAGRVLAMSRRGGRLSLGLAAGVLFAFILGALFGTYVISHQATGYSDVLRLRNGARLRGKVVNLVGNQMVVETQDSVYVIDSDQMKSLKYGRAQTSQSAGSSQFPDSEMIELKNGIVLRGRILNQTGSELVFEADGENFMLNRDQVRKITYLAEVGPK